jgi:hypothetical protein
MTPLVWTTIPLVALCLLAWAGIPLWVVFHRPDKGPDFSEARAYLHARQALIRTKSAAAAPAGLRHTRRRPLATWPVQPASQRRGGGQAQPAGTGRQQSSLTIT